MARQSAQAKPAGPRIDGAINGATHDGAINGMTATTKLSQAFAREIAQLSLQALNRTTLHIKELRKALSMEEVASIQMDFVKESLEQGAQHTRKLCEMLATLPLEMPETDPDDLLHLVTAAVSAVQASEAAGRAAAAKVERLSEVACRA